MLVQAEVVFLPVRLIDFTPVSVLVPGKRPEHRWLIQNGLGVGRDHDLTKRDVDRPPSATLDIGSVEHTEGSISG